MKKSAQKSVVPAVALLGARDFRFCELIVEGKTNTAAEIGAGYSEKCAASQGGVRSKRPHIIAAIAEMRAAKAKILEPLRDKVTKELQRLAFANIDDYIHVDEEGLPQVDFTNATREHLSAVTSVKTKRRTIYNAKGDVVGVEKEAAFTLADKYKGLELLGRDIGMFKPADQTITIDIADRLLEARKRYAQLEVLSDEDT